MSTIYKLLVSEFFPFPENGFQKLFIILIFTKGFALSGYIREPEKPE
jgi:hypothetical protein